MIDTQTKEIEAAEVVLPARAFKDTLDFFTGTLGFRVEAIFPADNPAEASIAGHGARLRLERAEQDGPPVTLRLRCHNPLAVAGGHTELTAPNGTRVLLVPADLPVVIPPLQPELVIAKANAAADWVVGRAGMRYRDLIPGRLGGRFIASHIAIPTAGLVPDYPHYHKVRFQMIFCRKGWVKLVYEDQGEPFLLEAGDCVLQPPRIRHRVLECSGPLEVIEIGCPALHETFADGEITLPTGVVNPARDFGGQRFVRHIAKGAPWRKWRLDGYEARDIGIAAGTDGLAGVQVVRPKGSPETAAVSHDAEFVFLFVLAGTLTLRLDGQPAQRLGTDDSVVVPAGLRHALTDVSADLEMLEVTLPAAFATVRHADAALAA